MLDSGPTTAYFRLEIAEICPQITRYPNELASILALGEQVAWWDGL